MEVEEIFYNARQLADAAEQQRYIASACGDNAIARQQVEQLLRDANGADNFFGAQASASAVLEGPGSQIGRYKLLQKIGEGGMGAVYMAEQREPVVRKVALKIVKLGMDTRQVVGRFEAERQALALMDHPNIAKVLEAGATETGRPYFVMELVRGIKITDYCDQNHLSTEQRLDLFTKICSAVQHAHQKGIIHRDLKPSNILVADHDGVPVPKIIDFGIAKATTGQSLTDKTVFTEFEQFIGTPAYMSPEQARLSGLDIDTRTDIYSLGVLLYELLTGKTPFDAGELLKLDLEQMRRTIREREPARPSTRLSTMLDADLSDTAKHRHTDPPKLVHEIRGDLDWIVMKCLEKDRSRRYETANAIAMDVQRHLRNEPILARPRSKLYEFKKSVQRHKFGFAAATVLVLVLAGGVIVSTRQAVRATRAEKQEADHRRLAEAEAAKSKQVAAFLQEMLRGVQPATAQGRDTTLLREILDKTTQRIGNDLKDQPDVEAEICSTIGTVYLSLGDYKNAERTQRLALQLREKYFGQTNVIVGETLISVARVLINCGDRTRLGEAETILQRAVSIPNIRGTRNEPVALGLLAAALQRQNNLTEAETLHRRVLELKRKTFGEKSDEVANTLNNLALVLVEQGKLNEAEPLFRESLEIKQRDGAHDQPGLAYTLRKLSGVLRFQQRLDEAETLARQSLQIERKLGSSEDNQAVADSLFSLAHILLLKGDAARLQEAETLVREARAIAQKPFKETAYSDATVQLLVVLERQGKTNEVQALAKDPRNWHSFSRMIWAQAQDHRGETNLSEIVKWVRIAEGVLPNDPKAQRELDNAYVWVAREYDKRGNFAESVTWWRKELAFERKLSGNSHTNVALSLQDMGIALEQLHELPDAEQCFREAVDIRRAAFRNGDDEKPLANALALLAGILLAEEKFTEAEAPARECLQIRQKLRPKDWSTFNIEQLLGRSLVGQKKYEEGEAHLLTGYNGLLASQSQIPAAAKFRIKETAQYLATLYDATAQPAKAAQWKQTLAQLTTTANDASARK